MRTPHTELPDIFDDVTVGITLHDPETGAVVDVNPRLEQLYGYPRDELRTMRVEDYTAPSTEYTQEEAVNRIRAAADGEPQRFEWQIERANGEFRWVQVHLNDTTIDNEPFVIAEITDITKYKDDQQRLQLLSRIVRHNLRNEMNVIAGYASLLRDAIENETLADAIDTVIDTANSVGTLSKSVSQLEQITSADTTDRYSVKLNEIAQSLVEEAIEEYPAADITVEESEDVSVVATKGLEYAIEHGIKNAVEHNDHETPSVTVRVTENTEHEMGMLQIRDNGPVIPDMETEILSDTAQPSSTYHGSGVGLWVMQWCLNSLGGELQFEKREPQGNIVSMLLPKAETPEEHR